MPPANPSLPETAPSEPPNRPLEAHVACWECGYDLFGVPTDGCCPECGAEAALTLTHAGERPIDPAWARSVARGARLLWIGIVASVVGPVVLFVAGVLGAGLGLWRTLETLFLPARVGLTGALISLAVAVFLFTTPPPRGEERDALGRAATLARVRGVTVVVFCGLALGIIPVLLHRTTLLQEGGASFLVMLHAVPLAIGLGLMLASTYALRLASRLSHGKAHRIAGASRSVAALLIGSALAIVGASASMSRGGLPVATVMTALLFLTDCTLLTVAAYLLDQRLRRMRMQ